ncbi:MAG: hypothetical protein Q4A15_09800 [Prevotellaceae bacterium]|nr:hypothetical protein [Prevotellaceae bacterium]
MEIVWHSKFAQYASDSRPRNSGQQVFIRFVFQKVNVRMLGIKGEKGVGKTTLVLSEVDAGGTGLI